MLQKKHMNTIRSILDLHLKPQDNTAFIFGSRAIGSAQKYSDIDIGIEGQPLSASVKAALEESFESSDLPFRVDVVDFTQVTKKFSQIAKEHILFL